MLFFFPAVFAPAGKPKNQNQNNEGHAQQFWCVLLPAFWFFLPFALVRCQVSLVLALLFRARQFPAYFLIIEIFLLVDRSLLS
ncbi:MAG: hypothetical protein IPI14_07845 [Polaromonas sp.]|nr:hypothetical protein [Polaromonas sp.]